MTRDKIIALLKWLSARLAEPSTRVVFVALLTMLGLSTLGAHLDLVASLITLAVIVMATPDAPANGAIPPIDTDGGE